MKSQKLYPVLIILAVFFLMGSCTQDEFIEDTNYNKSAISNHFKILPINDSNVRSAEYTSNYQVEIESSEFDIANDKIELEIPIPLSDFSFLKAYNVSTANNVAILYVIQREKQNVVVNLPINFVVQDRLTLSELNIDTELLAKNGCLRVYVMNNSEEDLLNEEDKITNCFMNTLDDYSCRDTYATPATCDFTYNGQNKRPGVVK
jgi:hypothetical protein